MANARPVETGLEMHDDISVWTDITSTLLWNRTDTCAPGHCLCDRSHGVLSREEPPVLSGGWTVSLRLNFFTARG